MSRRVIAAAALVVTAALVPAAPTTASETPPAPVRTAPVPDAGEEKAVDLRLGSPGSPARQEIRHPGAAYVKVHFARVALAPGDRLTVSDPAGREVHTYHGDPTRGAAAPGDAGFTRHGRGGFAAMSVDGDTAVVTLHTRGKRGSHIRIDRYWRGYTPAEFAAENPSTRSVCGADGRRDAVCYKTSHPAHYAASRGVARMLLNGGGYCTAWRVGRGNHMMTNNHCIKTQAELDKVELQFDYDCATCGGNDPRPGTKVGANALLRTSASLDFTLFSVDDFDRITQFGTLFLETRAPIADEQAYIAGHGDTRPKRISIYEERDGGAYCGVRTPQLGPEDVGYNCDTSGGSSGSPVLAGSSHKVIALHWGGSCPTNVGTRMEKIYPQIQDLIDNRP
ncbi:trypsin-like serine peptidase [Streptomyces spectabilis]|uniref:trypsin-like serine peptidase n=1 Tax=Streptomyces spectabilis TaxID=68270 RepID=UPI001CEF5C01|nr:serine protease [Streptomyces spectabilis]